MIDPCPGRIAAIRRAESLAGKINLLVDVIMTESGRPFDYPAIRDAAKATGYYISRTRWSLLKSGKEQIIPDELLDALAVVFDVDPEYLRHEDSKLPEQVEAGLALLRHIRRKEVRQFASRALGPVDPKALRAIVRVLDEAD